MSSSTLNDEYGYDMEVSSIGLASSRGHVSYNANIPLSLTTYNVQSAWKLVSRFYIALNYSKWPKNSAKAAMFRNYINNKQVQKGK